MPSVAPEDPTYSFSEVVPAPERRQNERYTTTMRIGVMLTEAGSELCLVRNISCGGLRARVYSDVKVGSRAQIELKSGQNVSGAVIWAQDEHIGLRFDQPVDVEAVLSSATVAADGRRSRLPRIEVARFAMVRVGARMMRAETVDISQGGVKLSLTEALELEEVVVSIAGLYPIRGAVRWQEGHYAGIEFNELIPLAQLVAWSKGGDLVKAGIVKAGIAGP